jgi:hypothetical protein
MLDSKGSPCQPGVPPTEYRMRCPQCQARYWVFTGAREFGRVFERASAKAEKCGAIFIDARRQPMLHYLCGDPLDFTPDECGVVM